MKIITRAAVVRLTIAAILFVIFCFWAYHMMIKMPGKTYTGPLPPLTVEQSYLAEQLQQDIQTLASEIGQRNMLHFKNLAKAADFIETSLTAAGYDVTKQNYTIEDSTCTNLQAEIIGTEKPDQIVIIGAHYDSVYGCPGANDNATGVAANLAFARRFKNQKCARTIRFVFFTNEEPPFYRTSEMGSFVYAQDCRKKNENITAMLSLETIGCYTNEPNSQTYPYPMNLIYPSTGNFIGFVSNFSSRKLLRRVVASFRKNAKFPSQGGALPELIPSINWSDHWSFYRNSYPAIMVTDTAPFRYQFYHTTDDTPDKINYPALARLITDLQPTILELANE